jgi:hypothetical protein
VEVEEVVVVAAEVEAEVEVAPVLLCTGNAVVRVGLAQRHAPRADALLPTSGTPSASEVRGAPRMDWHQRSQLSITKG